MARSRNIKPSIMDNEQLAELPALTRVLFIYMWMLADREGRLEDRPGRIKKQALGYDSCDVAAMLNELSSAGFIQRYEANGIKVIQITTFGKHQTPHVREAASELPGPEQSTTKAVPSTSLEDDEASPRSPDSLLLIPDSGFLIPDNSSAEEPPRKRGSPTAKPKPQPSASPARPEDVDEQTWTDWLALRAKKKADVSQTTVKAARDEAGKAGLTLGAFLTVWCLRGSQGLQADWLTPNERAGPAKPAQTFRERDADLAAARVAEMGGSAIAAKRPSPFPDFIDMEPPDAATAYLD